MRLDHLVVLNGEIVAQACDAETAEKLAECWPGSSVLYPLGRRLNVEPLEAR